MSLCFIQEPFAWLKNPRKELKWKKLYVIGHTGWVTGDTTRGGWQHVCSGASAGQQREGNEGPGSAARATSQAGSKLNQNSLTKSKRIHQDRIGNLTSRWPEIGVQIDSGDHSDNLLFLATNVFGGEIEISTPFWSRLGSSIRFTKQEFKSKLFYGLQIFPKGLVISTQWMECFQRIRMETTTINMKQLKENFIYISNSNNFSGL